MILKTSPGQVETAAHVISISVLVLNLRKAQYALFQIVLCWLFFPAVENELLFSRHYIAKLN